MTKEMSSLLKAIILAFIGVNNALISQRLNENSVLNLLWYVMVIVILFIMYIVLDSDNIIKKLLDVKQYFDAIQVVKVNVKDSKFIKQLNSEVERMEGKE